MSSRSSANAQSILGIGTDIIEIGRISEAYARHGDRFLSRLFTKEERNYCERYSKPIPHYAGRFAAKEAILKALGTGLIGELSWTEIEVLNNRDGKPEVHLSPRLQTLYPLAHLFLSISHCESYATATAILVG
ncbi:MAG: holo-ACP synthase [Chlamydiales bacterium]